MTSQIHPYKPRTSQSAALVVGHKVVVLARPRFAG